MFFRTKCFGLFAFAGVALAVVTLGCGDGEEPNDPNDPGSPGGENNAVAATLGGVSFRGQSGASIPLKFTASVADGELVVYLSSSEGSVIFFVIDMKRSPLPGSVTPGASLGDAAFLTVTSPGGVLESSQVGGIKVDQCPDARGKVITGSFSEVALSSPTGASSTLTGKFSVQVALHDGSHRCTSEIPPGKPQGPPGCAADGCDGPCCPYQVCMASCLAGCATNKCAGTDVMGCFGCMNGCPDQCGVSTSCRGCLDALNGCSQKHQCEPAPPEESACVGQHCCAEYKACF